MADLLNKKVIHKTFGTGIVIAQDAKTITIEFPGQTGQFQYPLAFEKFLTLEDKTLQNVIDAELAAIKAAEEKANEARAIASAKQAAEAAAKKAAAAKAAAKQAELAKKKSVTKSHLLKELPPVKRIPGQALTYLVFQGDTYEEECKGQFIWAPKYTKAGGTCHHWDRLMDIRTGDIIFHCSNGYIKAISIARGQCVDSARPDKSTGDWTQWEKDGRRVDCCYYVFKNPLKHGKYKEDIIERCSVKYAPFDKEGNGNMGYLFELDGKLAQLFLSEAVKSNPFLSQIPELSGIL